MSVHERALALAHRNLKMYRAAHVLTFVALVVACGTGRWVLAIGLAIVVAYWAFREAVVHEAIKILHQEMADEDSFAGT